MNKDLGDTICFVVGAIVFLFVVKGCQNYVSKQTCLLETKSVECLK